MLNTLQTTDIKDKELPLSKRDLHAAIAAFSFCFRAVVFGNVGSYSVVLKPPFILPNFPIIDITNTQEIKLIKEQESFDDIFQTYKF